MQSARNGCAVETVALDGCTIVPLKEKDAPELAELEAACFSLPWSEGEYRVLLRKVDAMLAGRDATAVPWRELPAFMVFGLRGREGRLRGYISLGLHHAAGEMEIYNIAVPDAFRRRGHGGALLRYVLARAVQGGMERALLEVRASNAPALALYASAGFTACGRRKGYYSDTGEDALVLCCDLKQEQKRFLKQEGGPDETADGSQLEDV